MEPFFLFRSREEIMKRDSQVHETIRLRWSLYLFERTSQQSEANPSQFS